jgi:hypothetical protein
MKVIAKGQVYGTGSGTAAVTVPAGNGLVVGRRAWYTSPAAGTIGIYRPRTRFAANAAVTATTTLVAKSDANGYVDGAVFTTNDYLLVSNPTTGAWVLSKISAVAAVSSSTVSLTIATAVTCSADQEIYLVRAADIVSVVTGTETNYDMDNWFVGRARGMPVYILLTASGTCHMATTYQIED